MRKEYTFSLNLNNEESAIFKSLVDIKKVLDDAKIEFVNVNSINYVKEEYVGKEKEEAEVKASFNCLCGASLVLEGSVEFVNDQAVIFNNAHDYCRRNPLIILSRNIKGKQLVPKDV